MKRSRVLSVAFVLFLVVGSGTPGTVVADSPEGLALQQSVDPDLVNLDVSLQEDGSAEWQIEYRVRLRTDNETQAFDDLIADVEENRSAYLDRFSDRMNATVDNAAESTGREMTATDFNVSARIGTLGRYGILTYTFSWSNFATVSEETITAGDALEGFFLDEDTTLEVSWPQDYQVSDVSPEPSSTRDAAVIWRGPLDFADGEPSLVAEYAPSATTTTATTGQESPTTEPTESGSAWPWMIGGIGALALLGGGVWYWTQREEKEDLPGAAPGAKPATPDEGTPAELLSNEERVEQYLGSHGGRAKQQEIVDGLDWTEAKTSQVLSDMQDAGRIEKFRIGRENVVKLPDSEDHGE